MNRINIAIDGYSSCGKSTTAKALAARLGYVFIDSGAMYRAVTLYALDNGLFEPDGLNIPTLIDRLNDISVSFRFDEELQRSIVQLNGEDVEHLIRDLRVSDVVSQVSAVPEVRKKLVALQQEMGQYKGVVMDGRDIGTVVFPNAELKIFMTARPEVRAQRRYEELQAKGQSVTLEEVAKNLQDRDYIDTHRATDPLVQAEDALVLDNSDITPEAQMELALSWAHERGAAVPA